MDSAARAAVLDIGKTNIKLHAVTLDGAVAESLSTPNTVRDGPPWRHHDLEGTGGWALAGLSDLCRRHPLEHIIAAGHGSGGVLVGGDPDRPAGGAVLPMIDYEQALPPAVRDAYAPLAGSFLDRGSAIMQGATHQARQLLWMEMAEPAKFAAARWYLGLPQYWAWRFSGVAASEASLLGAQSQLWNTARRRFSPIVTIRGWRRLMPPMARASAALGPLRPELARRHGLPDGLLVHTGAHDSSCNFYRYQAAGFAAVCVVSTGTWIVALADAIDPAALDERRNMTLNSDIGGNPVGGALVMGGREFSAVAGAQPPGAVADPRVIAALMARGTFALPAFGADSGQFPGAAAKGRIAGPPPRNQPERLALAVLYVALLAHACVAVLAPGRPLVLDGSYLRDPSFAALLASLRPGLETLINRDGDGLAAGAALLCRPDGAAAPAALPLDRAAASVAFAGAADYAIRWQQLSLNNL